jgi:TRAP-type C4-dicarboxylate transport system substrate-binding protein
MALACGAQAQTTLTFGGSDALGSILDRQNVRFTACVNDKAAGKLKVNFIQGEQLGSDVQVIEQTMQGSVQIYGDVLDWYANWVKDYAILAWGFTFRDAEHMQKFLDSPPMRRWPRSCARSRACASSPPRRPSRASCSRRRRSAR